MTSDLNSEQELKQLRRIRNTIRVIGRICEGFMRRPEHEEACSVCLCFRQALLCGSENRVGLWAIRKATSKCPISRMIRDSIASHLGVTFEAFYQASFPSVVVQIGCDREKGPIRIRCSPKVDLVITKYVRKIQQHQSGTGVQLGRRVLHASMSLNLVWIQKSLSTFQRSVFNGMDSWVTSMSRRFGLARNWLETCLKTHDSCQVVIRHPKRLLRIEAQSQTMSIKLIDGKMDSSATQIPYACLSYCWGGEQDFVLCKETKNTLEQGIVLEDLPEVIRDAALLTHNLGVGYLWIDSFCIFQDDLRDWTQEADQMASIYGGSIVTLSAANSASVQKGFLQKCNLPSVQPFGVQYIRGLNMGISSPIDHAHWLDTAELSENTPAVLPLHKRSWTLQENILSPRVLTFGRHEMVWQCKVHTRCECLTMQNVGQNSSFPSCLPTKLQFDSLRKQPNEKKLDDLRTFWDALIDQYSQRDISKETDRLIALHGIIHELEPNWGRCLFGHWEAILPESLFWRSRGNSARLPQVARAPTWSWASLEHPYGILKPLKYRSSCKSSSQHTPQKHDDFDLGKIGIKVRVTQSIDDCSLELQCPVIKMLSSIWFDKATNTWVFCERESISVDNGALDEAEQPILEGEAELDTKGRSGRFIICIDDVLLAYDRDGGAKFRGLLCNKSGSMFAETYERVGVCMGIYRGSAPTKLVTLV